MKIPVVANPPRAASRRAHCRARVSRISVVKEGRRGSFDESRDESSGSSQSLGKSRDFPNLPESGRRLLFDERRDGSRSTESGRLLIPGGSPEAGRSHTPDGFQKRRAARRRNSSIDLLEIVHSGGKRHAGAPQTRPPPMNTAVTLRQVCATPAYPGN